MRGFECGQTATCCILGIAAYIAVAAIPAAISYFIVWWVLHEE